MPVIAFANPKGGGRKNDNCASPGNRAGGKEGGSYSH